MASFLAEASLLAYVPDREFVRETLLRAGFEGISFHSAGSTHAFAARAGGTGIALFRGTEPLDPEDWRTDLRALLEPGEVGRVHRGFRAALELVRAPLEEALGDAPCHFAGHSLGGALATLAAARRAAPSALHTYGSPRVGDEEFARLFRPPAWRVVNNSDLVPHLPPPVGYRHVGRLLYLDRDGRLHAEPGREMRLLDMAAGHLARLREAAARGYRGVLWDALVDHSPWHYARLLRALSDPG